MTIDFECSNCRQRLTVPASVAGKKASCPACGGVSQVPEPPAVVATAEVLDAEVVPAPTPSPPALAPVELITPPPTSTAPSALSPPTVTPTAEPTMPSSVSQNSAIALPSLAPSIPVVDAVVAEEPTSPASPPADRAATPPPVDLTQWQMRTPEGISYGPVSRSELEAWVREGRVTAECDLRPEHEPLWHAADKVFPALTPWAPQVTERRHSSTKPVLPAASRSQRDASRTPDDAVVARVLGVATAANVSTVSAAPAAPAAPVRPRLPDRGILVLTLGIVGLVVQCPVFSVMAWVMGTSDLQEMQAGRMDERGLTSTQWGRRLGMIGSMLWVALAVAGTIWGLYLATL